MQDIWKALLIQYGWRHQALTDLNMSDGPFFTRSRKDSTFHRGKGNQVEWNHMWDEKGGGELMWGEEDILGREKGRRAKGEMMDWTWEDNEEWNTVQQNVISQTVVWGALLPFHWDCYYRWISPTKTSIPRVQHFLDFCSDRGRLWKPGIESRPSVSPNEAALALRWRLNRRRARMYLWMKAACYEHFLLVLIFRVKREKKCHCGFAVWRHTCLR